MHRYKVGIIGYGGFGKFLHHWWSDVEQAAVVAVADPNTRQTEDLKTIAVFSDWRRLLREKDIELVAIVTLPATHTMIATAAMEAGKHVLIEKPPAITPEDARKLIQVRDQTQRVAAVDLIMRFNPLLQTLHKWNREGVFGKLRRVAVENYAQDEQLPPGHWFWDTKQSGGILIEHGVHFIDLVHFLQPARPLAVNGLQHDRNPQQEDQVMANVVYEGGLLATHYHSFARPGFFEDTTIRLAYDLADIEVHGWIPLWADVKALVNPHTKAALEASVFFEPESVVPLSRVNDESRPEGWGLSGSREVADDRLIRSGGLAYEVSELLTGKLRLNRSKKEVYGQCVRASLLDVLKKVEDPAHELAAPLEAGLASLELAVQATEAARTLPGYRIENHDEKFKKE